MDNRKKEANDISINDMDYLKITSDIKESPRIQKTEYIRQQMLKRRAMEDALMEDLKQEQSVIDSFRDQINDGMIQTEELSRYNQEFNENMTEQIYLLHGISKDKLEGMQECKNAFRRGYSIVLFLLSTALTILCGALHGFQSGICLLMLAITGLEGAMLAQDNSLDHYPLLRLINRVLFPLLCPLMMTMFVCYELGFAPYDFLLPYIAMAGIVLLFLSAVPYFIYDPYKGMGKHMRNAKAEIKVVEKVAKKEISKNQRIRVKEEKENLAKQAKEDRRQEILAKKEAKEAEKQERIAKKETEKEERNAQKAAQRLPKKNASTTETPAEAAVETAPVNTAEAEQTAATPNAEAGATAQAVVTTAVEANTTPQVTATPVVKTDTAPQVATKVPTEIAPEKSEAEPAQKSDLSETSTKQTDIPEIPTEQAAKPETPKKRRTRKKNPVIDITEGSQNLAAHS